MLFIIFISLYSSIIFDSLLITRGEYYIKEKSVPSFLFHKFDNLPEDIFPLDIMINITLSKIAGTIMYSIDKRMNQLKVSLYDGMFTKLIIEFNAQKYFVSLQDLCGCEICRYLPLDLRLSIGKDIHLRCRDRNTKSFSYLSEKKINKRYPLPYRDMNQQISAHNGAHLWLVNWPQYNNTSPNSEQLSGCIFDVRYNDKPIIFTNISDNIEQKCKESCNDHICNGGHCYDTYNMVPVCDCTLTFLNGRYCNDSIIVPSNRPVDKYYQFIMFKVSWISSGKDILTMSNKAVEIRLFQSGQTLSFQYNLIGNVNMVITSKLSESYVLNIKYILIAYFDETHIVIKFKDERSWNDVILYVNNIARQIFSSVQSSESVIDFVYRTSSMEYKWKRGIITKNAVIQNEPLNVAEVTQFAHQNDGPHNVIPNVPDLVVQVTRESDHTLGVTKMPEKYNPTTIILGIVLAIVIIAVIILGIALLVKCRRAQRWKKHDDSSTPDVSRSQSETLLEKNNDELAESMPENTYPESLRTLRAKQKEQEQRACIYWKPHPYGSKEPHNTLQAFIGVYIMRAKLNNDWIIGTFRSGDKFGYLPFNGLEVPTAELELLCYSDNFGNGETIEWVNDSNGRVPATAIIGCHTRTNTPLYIARGEVDGEMCVGKVNPCLKCASVPYKGSEKKLIIYDVLCYK